ncbi:hypothetical protein [Streptomyces sp. MZ04]|uniref:hypothetical protein n=1 Tax=Streptomyces sp. MZ04 TaxID=2559236 RepID=UPI00107E6FA3|nr:hypothetical protein [Streptomyces sp. MZ04]TGB13755.1 hypothetical protein E2651_08075 [Streptomyces sp. MZ04]
MTQPPGTPGTLRQTESHGRLWEYFLREDAMIMKRGNLFLVAQSLQLVAYTAIVSTGHEAEQQADSNVLTARVIAAFGIALATIWLYVGHRQIRYTNALVATVLT